jgi:hypothetical protein
VEEARSGAAGPKLLEEEEEHDDDEERTRRSWNSLIIPFPISAGATARDRISPGITGAPHEPTCTKRAHTVNRGLGDKTGHVVCISPEAPNRPPIRHTQSLRKGSKGDRRDSAEAHVDCAIKEEWKTLSYSEFGQSRQRGNGPRPGYSRGSWRTKGRGRREAQ